MYACVYGMYVCMCDAEDNFKYYNLCMNFVCMHV